MKGLSLIPQDKEIARAIEILQFNAQSLNEKDWVFYSQWARFDPRLAEVWVLKWSQCWKTLNPILVQRELRGCAWPSAIGPLLDQAQWWVESSEISSYRAIRQFIETELMSASGELYWIGLFPFYSESQQRLHQSSLSVFTRWGYLADDVLVNKPRQKLGKKKTLLTREQRKQILNQFLKKHRRISVAEYSEALGERVSIRIAQLDLRSDSRLSPIGKTRARVYVRKT